MTHLSALLAASLALWAQDAAPAAIDALAYETPGAYFPIRCGPGTYEPEWGCRCDACGTHAFWAGCLSSEFVWDIDGDYYGPCLYSACFCPACRAEGSDRRWREGVEFCRAVAVGAVTLKTPKRWSLRRRPCEAPKPPAYMADPSIHQVLYLTPKGFLPAERPGLLFLDASTGEYGPAKEARR